MWCSCHLNLISVLLVAAKVLSISEHTVQGSTLQLQYANAPKVLEEEPAEEYEANKLLIRQIPQNVDEEHLQLFLEKVLQMEHQDDFVVEVSGGSAVITFHNAQLSVEGTGLRMVCEWASCNNYIGTKGGGGRDLARFDCVTILVVKLPDHTP